MSVEIPDNINISDIKFLKSMNLEVEEKNLATFSYLKKIGAEYDNEQTLYASVFMAGHSDPKDNNYSKLGEKLCGYFNKGTFGNREENKEARIGIISYLRENRKKIDKENEIQQQKILEEHKKKMQSDPRYSSEFEKQKIEMKKNMEKIIELMAIKKMNEKLRDDYSKKVSANNSSLWLKKTSIERKLAAGLEGFQQNKVIENVNQSVHQLNNSNVQKRGRGF